MKKQTDKINRNAKIAEIARIKGLITERISRAPGRVMNGSYQTAVEWKKAAIRGKQAAESKAPTLKKIQEAFGSLNCFYS